jgi:hypothetical protein
MPVRVYLHWRPPSPPEATSPRGGAASVRNLPPSAHNTHSSFPPSPILHITSSVPPPPQALVMPRTSATAETSSCFQAVFQAALNSYQKQTKKDLLAHPLASQLKSCESTAAILAILQGQVQQFDKSRGDERLTKWLGPTVNVLCAFSATISGGISLVLFYSSAYASF